jgi:hypothetical protein
VNILLLLQNGNYPPLELECTLFGSGIDGVPRELALYRKPENGHWAVADVRSGQSLLTLVGGAHGRADVVSGYPPAEAVRLAHRRLDEVVGRIGVDAYTSAIDGLPPRLPRF